MIKISVIVPVYQAEKYLPSCLDSILNQSFPGWECILIDDGSCDLSGEICDKYSAIDSRFVTIHKSNGGVSEARNQGLEKASGNWITFLDSDDTLDKNAFEVLVSHAEKQNLDLIQFLVTKTERT